MLIDEKALQKIQKLHALTLSNHSGESGNAKKKRDLLLKKHNLSIEDIDKEDSSINDCAIIIEGKQKLTILHSMIISILKECFFVDVLYGNQKDPESGRIDLRLTVIGNKADIDTAKYAFSVLAREFKRVWDKARKEKGLNTKHRTSFFVALGSEVTQSLKQEGIAMAQEWGLVVVDNKKERSSYTKEKFRPRTVTKTRLVDNDAHAIGKQYASEVQFKQGLKQGKTKNKVKK